MNKQIGYSQTVPKIKFALFQKGKIILKLEDGRVLELPLARFPEIKGLTPNQRRKCKILAGMGLMFDDLDTVYHISDFMGKEIENEFSMVAEKKTGYKKSRTEHS